MEQALREELLARLKSIEGHVRGVSRMVGEERYCIDIIRQCMAVQKALDRVNSLILEGHLQTCVTAAIRAADPDECSKVLAELKEVFDMASKL